MNKLALSLLLGTALVSGCGGDSTDEQTKVEQDPVKTTIDISGVSAIDLTLDSFDPQTGSVEFSLKDPDGLAIVNAQQYRIRYFGFPPQGENSANPKAWKLWHVVYSYQCDGTSCDEQIQARDGDGQYSFVPRNLYWNRDTAPGTTGRYRVAIEIFGNDVSNEVALLAPTGQ
ncbi:hypothetical protein HR45_01775 [Shewanella mangrovi]|uniref:Lipoprotein n=1 Tax=Shewanella mangrovi TaxID=1515746 RepID=A0A094LV95_9GAMM|nr:hypothetical protein [Shewanella mangrovi]KFZ39153.1 hypothetical protein HR45_01775 [Shewanella mangrovi]